MLNDPLKSIHGAQIKNNGSGEEQHFVNHTVYHRGLGTRSVSKGIYSRLLLWFFLSPLFKEMCGMFNHDITHNWFCFAFTFKLSSIRNYTKSIPLIEDDKQNTFLNTSIWLIKKTSVRCKVSGSPDAFGPVTETLFIAHS